MSQLEGHEHFKNCLRIGVNVKDEIDEICAYMTHYPNEDSSYMLFVCSKALSSLSKVILVCVILLIVVDPQYTSDDKCQDDKHKDKMYHLPL